MLLLPAASRESLTPAIRTSRKNGCHAVCCEFRKHIFQRNLREDGRIARMMDVVQDKIDCWSLGSIPLACPKSTAGVWKLGDSIVWSLRRIHYYRAVRRRSRLELTAWLDASIVCRYRVVDWLHSVGNIGV